MKVLFVVRPDAATKPGGDLVHAHRTAEALRTIGVGVDIATSAQPDAAGYDVAHVFGIFEPELAAAQMTAVRAQGVPLALSPIWLDLTEFLTKAPRIERALQAKDAASVERHFAQIARPGSLRLWPSSQERGAARRLRRQMELVNWADVLLPASDIEATLYVQKLRARVPCVVAPLGVEEEAFKVCSPAVRTGVVCAARIEPKKNQAAMLYALRDVDVDVTLIGSAYDPAYFALCERWASSRTRFIEHSSQPEVLQAMSRAAVHAHPSWFESPGLSSLEAAAAGAHVVVGNRGTEPEYFGENVEYADPASVTSIRTAVMRALKRPARERGDALESHLRTLTWQRAADATLEAYNRVLRR